MQRYSHVFEGITDPRRSNATCHDLHEMLMIALLSVLSDGETCTDMAQFGQEKEDFLRGFMTLKHGIPSHDAFSDLFNGLNLQELGHTLDRLSVDWSEMFGDPVMATALLDRLLHHSIVITITGNSYRLRADLVHDHVRARKSLLPPPPLGKRGRGKKGKGGEEY